jgi:hypothetical protein
MKRRPWVGCEGSKIQFAYWSLWTNTVALVDFFAVSPQLVFKELICIKSLISKTELALDESVLHAPRERRGHLRLGEQGKSQF